METTLITLDRIGKTYGDKTALHDVNFTIYPGEFVALVGMSGGGKSTILRLIAELEQPTAGTITRAQADLVVRVMFQNDRLLPWMTTLDNLSFDSHDKAQQDKAKKTLASVGLKDFADQYPNQLSGGQKQRVALARALMADPQLLLLDEPLGALDALTRRNMQQFIGQVCDQGHLTTLLITHDVDEAARMADRIIVIKNGTNVYEAAGAKGQNAETVAKVAEEVLQVILRPDDDPTQVEAVAARD
ncbi:ABC transporter ATP-binding protein [Lacticaseibacillus yichunensis]|uniref:ABC transporter ATP-binding protein n=1 Tax=Lacticaseibacillus yichunensis TaxID=2486015 RepID=A0ABW4CPU7_9LACO|nr:ATP-binding cassette domain-containing protein [Lacticaseibacillus yichunensis]